MLNIRTAWIVMTCIVNLSFAGSDLIKTDNEHNIDLLTSCVLKIIEEIDFKNLSRHRDATVVNSNDDLKLSALHSKENLRFVSRKFSWKTKYISNDLYILTCKNIQEFETGLDNMTSDPYWNPIAVFIIVIKDLEDDNLKNVTDILRSYNVIYNVTVISQKGEDYAIYMYNITSPTNCLHDIYLTLASWCSVYQNTSSLPFLKFAGIRNCTFKLITHNSWPYVNFDSKTKGIEQYLIHLFTKHNGINIDLERTSKLNRDGEVQKDFTIKFVQKIAKNDAEAVFGGLTVRPFYVGNFTYTYPWRIDHVSFILPHAFMVRQWAAVSHDTLFTCILLVLLFVSFCTAASTLSIFRRREKDVVLDILTVFGYFLSKTMIRKTRPGWARSLIVSVLLYASFIFPFVLQTNLCSVTTQPLRSYEPRKITDILKFQPILYSESLEKAYFPEHINCGSKFQCLHGLIYGGKSNQFTAMSDFYYYLYGHQLLDEWCKPALYRLRDPLIRIYRTFVFRRGSVLLEPVNRFLLRVDATGVLSKILRDIFVQRRPCPPGRPPVNPPIKFIELRPVFLILLTGHCLSALVFLCELKLGASQK